jgi:methylated-DNA-[protein]-cysteine S-methyltransferase
MNPLSYLLVPSNFGTLSIVWQKIDNKPMIHQIFLPNKKYPIPAIVHMTYRNITTGTCPTITELSKRIQKFLCGETVDFTLDYLLFERCSEFQKKVLITEYKIPRGKISTYGTIARILRNPHSARAVGRALATNPFPIVIPCHRALKSNGELGGYQGGVMMKRALLEFEGVKFSSTGKVSNPSQYYEWNL